MRVGVVGLGLIGKKRIANLPENCQLTFLCDVNEGLLKKIREEYPKVPTTSNFVELVNSTNVDLVVIATTHADLYPIAEASLLAGKHVIVEKPGTTDPLLMQQLIGISSENNLMLRIGYNHRFHPGLLKAKEIIDSGKHGKLLWIRGRYGHGGRVGYESEWRAKKSISGGGELIDQGSHLIDLVRFLVGDVTLAFGETQTSFWKMEVEDNAYIALRPAIGGFAWLHASWTEWKNTFSLEITLETAKIDISGLGGSYGVETLTYFKMKPEMGPPDSEVFKWEASDESWNREMKDVLNSINGSTPIGATGHDAAEVLKIVKGIYNR